MSDKGKKKLSKSPPKADKSNGMYPSHQKKDKNKFVLLTYKNPHVLYYHFRSSSLFVVYCVCMW